MVVLFELAVQISRVHDRRKERRLAAEDATELDPDQPSPLDYNPDPVDASPPSDVRAGWDDVT
jgi:sec-independent protein translocase protein TatC